MIKKTQNNLTKNANNIALLLFLFILFYFLTKYETKIHMLNHAKPILPIILINKPILVNIVHKRFMLTRAMRNIMYRGGINNHALPTQPHKDYATWNVVTRINEPVYLKPSEKPPMKLDPETGLEIMHNTDFSGKNHSLLIDKDYKSDIYSKVYGSFTTSPSPFMGKKPIFVGNIDLSYRTGEQYFHHYDKPRLIEKSKIVLEEIHTTSVSCHDYQKVFNKIETTI